MAKKRKKIWASDAERDAWDARADEHIRQAHELARKGWAELGIPEPEDKLAYLEGLLEKAERG